MPPLKNIRHERFTQEYIAHEGNGKRAYIAVPAYNKASEISAEKSASRLLRSVEIRGRIKEHLQAQKGTKPEDVSRKYNILLNAKRPIVIDDKIEYVDDNACQLETAKTISKIYGDLGQGERAGDYHDNRSINISLNSNDVNKLDDICKRLERMKNRDDFISGEILDSKEIGATPRGG